MNGTQKQLKRVAALLGEETTLALATAGRDGEACVAPLFYIADEELALYWFSSESSRHSLNAEETASAAATVYRGAKSWREIRGVQLRGVVSKVSEPERRAALLNAYCERFKLGAALRLVLRRSALYCLRPEFFRFIDNGSGFGFKFELTRPPEGWKLTRPSA